MKTYIYSLDLGSWQRTGKNEIHNQAIVYLVQHFNERIRLARHYRREAAKLKGIETEKPAHENFLQDGINCIKNARGILYSIELLIKENKRNK